MTIQEVEKLAGMTRANIRFYEKEGLITPERNEANNYREYRDSDVEALRKIKYLRMLGISVKDIKRIIEKELELPEAAECRLEELKEEKKNLEEIEWMCRYIRQHNIQYETMNSEMFGEKMGRLTEVFKDVLSMDTEKEYITVRELNRTIGLILIYGFVLSAVLSFFFGNIFPKWTFHMAFRGVVYHFYCDRAGLSMYIKAWNSICIVPDISAPSGACCPRIYRNGCHGASSDNEGTGGAEFC